LGELISNVNNFFHLRRLGFEFIEVRRKTQQSAICENVYSRTSETLIAAVTRTEKKTGLEAESAF